MTGRVEKRQKKPDTWDKRGRKEKGKRHFRVVLKEKATDEKIRKFRFFSFSLCFPLLSSPVSISFAQQAAK